ncbi:hypothetical protein SCP_1402120 [Sparassis crispa]|uniref:HMG box domain-containing protein n=1 Tax=Sparassis crispa TaxID=139825 RepID=A0A401H2Z8_9APHY|nr:hypothetical protein SCP_1402120 [Sparassis crispa]GBE88807.1 hypothetical protein SCP_1402120 [Sparassis crispa]
MPVHRTRDIPSRPSEVATDAPLPQVAIHSPTPRAFTFPIHNAPYASTSSSPFEPDLKLIVCTPPPLRTFSPTSSIDTDSSSILSSPSAPASQASHKRRRSAASDIGERRPKKGDDDYIKRPENAFILFRRKCCEDRQAQEEADEHAAPVKKQRQADLSKTISQQWKGLSQEDRQYWEDLAKEKKKEHETMYPNYVYRPQRVKKAKKGKARGEHDTDADSNISFVLPVSSPPSSPTRASYGQMRIHGHGRRAASAPTPPPAYQMIQLPQVIMPSCPTSPSLIPRISRRTPLPNIPPPSDTDPLTHFEYLPNGAVYPSSFQQPAIFEGNFQPSDELLQSMFQVPEQPKYPDQSAPMLPSLTIPRAPMMSPGMMSPADSIASSLVSPLDPFSPSPISQQGGPFTPADALSLSMLSVSNSHERCVEGIPEDVSCDMQSSNSPYMTSQWQNESIWSESDAMIPDDFDLNAIPPVEMGMSQYEGEMQFAALSSRLQGCEFQGGEFLPAQQANNDDFNDTTPGHDPFAGVFLYENTYENIPW